MNPGRLIILLLFTLPLPIMYWVVENIDEKYDWFLFADFEQKAMWYVHYSAYHIENIIKTFVIFILARNFLDKKQVKIIAALLYLSIFRLVEYWLFRHNIPMIPVIGIIIIYSIYVYSESNGR